VTIRAVVFDLDGVIIDTEEVWEEVRRGYVAEHGREFLADSQTRMMGMSTGEWSTHLSADVGVPRTPEQVAADVLGRMAERYRADLPLIPGSVDAVRRIAERFPVALASSSARILIDQVLETAGLTGVFRVTLSTEEVPRGKPAPDVYLEACRRLGVAPARAAAVEDSHAGIGSAKAAGMRVVAVPNPSYPPGEEALAGADLVIDSLDLFDSRGKTLRIGSARLHVLGETRPCERMEETFPGLRAAMRERWGGGAYAEVIEGGDISVGDAVEWVW